MAIQGLRNTGVTGGTGAANDFVAGQRPLNWREGILLLYPNGMAPLTGLTSVMKSKSCDDPEFNWWEKSLSAQRAILGANITTTATAITLGSGGKSLSVGAIVYAEHTGEVMRVTAIGSDTSITVVRDYNGGGTTGTAITYNASGTNPYLVVIGTAFEEGSSAPDGMNFDPTKMTNYLQIFRNTLEMTNTAIKTNLRTGDAIREAKRECLEYHSIQMEKAFFLGKKKETTLSGKPIRMTGGILEWITTNASGNVATAEAPMTLANLEEHLRKAFAYGSSEKMAFLGNKAMLKVQQCIRLSTNAQYVIEQGQKEFGMNVSRLLTPFGTLILKTHPLFNQISGGTSLDGTGTYVGMESWMYILDMDKLQYRYLKDRDTKYEAKYETPGQDSVKSGYISECGLEIGHASAHYILKNINTVAAG